MEIVLIADGKLTETSLLRKLPLFFQARLADMSGVSERAIGDASLVVIDMCRATPDGIKNLKRAAKSFAQLPVIAIVDTADRREVVQAASICTVDLFDRASDVDQLIRKIREKLGDQSHVEYPDDLPGAVREAFQQVTRTMDEIFLSTVSSSNMPVRMLVQSAKSIGELVSREGVGNWLRAVQLHHSHTCRHSMMVAGFASALAQAMDLSAADQETVVAGGLLHDIGKMKIPISILEKPGDLTDSERALIKKHPEFGREILKTRLEVPRELKKIAVQHHEYLDGTGYPNGLKAKDIDQYVRIVTICDIFCALIEARSYKDSLPPRAAVAAMKSLGSKLDQQLLAKFVPLVVTTEFAGVQRIPEDAASESLSRSA
ncbi:putative nucleotidyltransferase with HDIG domain [Roseibium hamelinense]|uniref:Putative nucleotidyltransferase with HDIG domain n=1 Tax=Roseibium hamelinense TaxID=150831 RepID=A0A562SXP7_9HYPH|nr:HD domain-containing phosphohydrolase [Roseibium hamelinense]MTI43594.1 HD domain-containing protein [Roseibium hamelinense]TWI86109.1 putative nucleotidyltransferase with HDIG domain [Roseibium hamelinense]